MNVPARWFVEPVTIETHEGQGAYGDVYAAPVTVLGHVTGGRLAQFTVEGEQVTSDRRLLLPNPARLADGSGTVDPTTLLTPETRVTSGAVAARVRRAVEHRQPGTGAVVYMSAELL